MKLVRDQLTGYFASAVAAGGNLLIGRTLLLRSGEGSRIDPLCVAGVAAVVACTALADATETCRNASCSRRLIWGFSGIWPQREHATLSLTTTLIQTIPFIGGYTVINHHKNHDHMLFCTAHPVARNESRCKNWIPQDCDRP